MHTDPKRSSHGQDLPHLINHLGLDQGQVLLSTTKVSPQELANLYRMADYTINISDAEGFGLATLESLSCGTPIIVNMTGGLQEQVTDGKNWFGFGNQPCLQNGDWFSSGALHLRRQNLSKETLRRHLHLHSKILQRSIAKWLHRVGDMC